MDGGTGATAGVVRVGSVHPLSSLELVVARPRCRAPLAATTALITGGLTANSLSVATALTAAGEHRHLAPVAGAVTTAGALTVSGTAFLSGSILLGQDGLYTLGRPAYTTQNNARSTYVLGQAPGSVASIGGDLVLEGGTGGVLAGSVRIGQSSQSVHVGSAAKSVFAPGALVAGSVSITGLASATALSTTGPVTASALTTAGAISSASVTLTGVLSAAGSAAVRGTLQLGDDAMYTIGRRAYSQSRRGRSSYVLGQAAGHTLSNGGDLVLDAGTGSLPGFVYVGGSSDQVVLGQSNKATVVLGALLANTVSVTALLSATTGLSTAGGLTSNTASFTGFASAGSMQVSGPLTVNRITVTTSLSSAALDLF